MVLAGLKICENATEKATRKNVRPSFFCYLPFGLCRTDNTIKGTNQIRLFPINPNEDRQPEVQPLESARVSLLASSSNVSTTDISYSIYSIQCPVNYLPCILVIFIKHWIFGKLRQGDCCSPSRNLKWQWHWQCPADCFKLWLCEGRWK